MPPKVRERVRMLEKAGFTDRGGKGRHRNRVHPKVDRPIISAGSAGDDAKQCEIRAVNTAIEESKK